MGDVLDKLAERVMVHKLGIKLQQAYLLGV
jgi:hypothetical protein